MPIFVEHVRDTLNAYLSLHPEDKERLAGLSEVIDQAGDFIVSRKEFRGHATAGAVLVRPDGCVLAIEHRALSRWLLPGGHLESEDESLAGAALRELVEETGIDPVAVTLVVDLPMHIDAHPIPANPAKGEPDHQHFDFRFLFRTTADAGQLQAEEVTAASWQQPTDLLAEPLRSRVIVATS
jgi:8-oxo-dGTP pyrophosphatase MutT (NUDIX family)